MSCDSRPEAAKLHVVHNHTDGPHVDRPPKAFLSVALDESGEVFLLISTFSHLSTHIGPGYHITPPKAYTLTAPVVLVG